MGAEENFLDIEQALEALNEQYTAVGSEAKCSEEKLNRLKGFLVNTGMLFPHDEEKERKPATKMSSKAPMKRRFSEGRGANPPASNDEKDLEALSSPRLKTKEEPNPTTNPTVEESHILRLALANKSDLASSLEGRCENLQSELTDRETQFNNLTNRHNKLADEHEALCNKKKDVDEYLSKLKSEFEALSSLHMRERSEMEKLKQDSCSLQSDIETLTEEKAQVQNDLNSMTELWAQCTSDMTDLQDEKERLHQLDEENKERIKSAQKSNDQLFEIIEQLKKEHHASVAKLEEQVKSVQSELEKESKVRKEKEDTEKSLQKQVETLTKDLNETKGLLQESRQSNEDVKELLKTSNEDCGALVLEKKEMADRIQALETQLTQANEESDKRFDTLTKREDELETAKSKISALESKLEQETKKKNELTNEFAACRLAANEAMDLIGSIEAFSEHVPEQKEGTTRLGDERENENHSVDPADTPKSTDSEEIQNTMGWIGGLVKAVGGSLKDSMERNAELSKTLSAYEVETLQTKDKIKHLSSNLETKTTENQKYARDLDSEQTRKKELETALKKKEEQNRKIEYAFHMATQENLSLREKMVTLKEARAAKCVTLEHELERVRAAFRFLEQEIHTAAPQTPKVRLEGEGAAPATARSYDSMSFFDAEM